MRVLTWNLNFRRDVPAQVAAALVHSPDVVVFQEVRSASYSALAEVLAAAGLGEFRTSVDAVGGAAGPNRYVAVASRWPMRSAEPVGSPVPQTAVCEVVESPDGPFDLVGVYVPSIARADGVKVPTQLAIRERLRRCSERPHLVCGDFNSPKAESAEGVTLFTRPVRVAEFEGEHALMGGLVEVGMRDAFRDCNGFDVEDRSWFWKNRGRTGGYRLDHIFVSAHFEVGACWYDHTVRERGLSDHSLMVAEVSLRRED
jgi:exonuclease III